MSEQANDFPQCTGEVIGHDSWRCKLPKGHSGRCNPHPTNIPSVVIRLVRWAHRTSESHTAYDPGKCPCELCEIVRSLPQDLRDHD